MKKGGFKKVNAKQNSGARDDVSRASQPVEQSLDEAAFWKDKYARLHADLDNTKKRLGRL